MLWPFWAAPDAVSHPSVKVAGQVLSESYRLLREDTDTAFVGIEKGECSRVGGERDDRFGSPVERRADRPQCHLVTIDHGDAGRSKGVTKRIWEACIQTKFR